MLDSKLLIFVCLVCYVVVFCAAMNTSDIPCDSDVSDGEASEDEDDGSVPSQCRRMSREEALLLPYKAVPAYEPDLTRQPNKSALKGGSVSCTIPLLPPPPSLSSVSRPLETSHVRGVSQQDEFYGPSSASFLCQEPNSSLVCSWNDNVVLSPHLR